MNEADLETVEREARSMAREQENERNNREAADCACLRYLAAFAATFPAVDLLFLGAGRNSTHDKARSKRIDQIFNLYEQAVDMTRDLLKPGA